ncbi:MAG: pullulanase-type alpha-1,6-glucosidase [Ancrocorticia sp.]
MFFNDLPSVTFTPKDPSFARASGARVTTIVDARATAPADLEQAPTRLEQPSEPVPGEYRALGLWLDETTIAWPNDGSIAGHSWRLYYAARGGMTRVGAAVEGFDGSVPLRLKLAGLSQEQRERDPYLTARYTANGKDYLALEPTLPLTDLAAILTGEVAVLHTVGGKVASYSALQTARLLDHLYAARARTRRLGAIVNDDGVTFRIWAPTAKSVTVRLFTRGEVSYINLPMDRRSDGSWSVSGPRDWVGRSYLYNVQTYVPYTTPTAGCSAEEVLAGSVQDLLVTDPYSKGLTADGRHSVVVDLDDPQYMPEVWRTSAPPRIANPAARTIVELHVRDFSATDETVPAAKRGTYAAFGERDSHGMRYLRGLAAAGMNTVHLLPTYDFGSVPEARAARAEAKIPQAEADSTRQQAAVVKVADEDSFNWGYDPVHYSVPEGSYASDVRQNGAARTAEFREMVGNLHAAGFQVVLDQVFNHTFVGGLGDKSVLEKVVPGYYHRLDNEGGLLTTPCSAEVATEHVMAEHLILDSALTWARHYRVDGFRFDLMEFHSVGQMRRIREMLDELTVERDSVDGRSMYVYGEGWAYGSVADGSRFEPSVQGALSGTGIGTFNDRLRDAVHGAQSDPRIDTQGFGNGLFTDPNGVAWSDEYQLRHYTDVIRVGLAGNLADFTFRCADGMVRAGRDVRFHGMVVGYASEPHEAVNYVDAHDNETLFDLNMWKLPPHTRMADRVRMNTLSLATVTLGQSPVFWHAGTDLLRSKSMDTNSYNSGDWFNAVDWSGRESNFGVGMPPAPDNARRWDGMRPFLADPANKPDAAAIAAAREQARDLLRLRACSPLFRLGSAELIKEMVSFPCAGPEAPAGLLIMRIHDRCERGIDRERRGVLVAFNAAPWGVDAKVEGMAGVGLTLSRVQRAGNDVVVKHTRWERESGVLHVPGRTVAVLEELRF